MTADVFTPPATTAPCAPPRVRELVLPAMRAAVHRLDPTNRTLAAYHLGWTERDGDTGREGGAGRSGGKGLRPALALLSAEAVGAAPIDAVPAAVAVELVHNFSLLHDDVMDGDTHRRHRETVWAVWGVPSAILAGDALLALAVEVLLDAPAAHSAEAVRLITTTTRELIRGQTQDLAFERRRDVGIEECLAMARDKTGVLLGASAAIGAVLVGGPSAASAALSRFGSQLGLAFQLVDDLLGIWGDPARTGKPVYSDLRAGKKTLPVTYALSRGGAAGQELAEWLAGPAEDVEQHLPRAAELVEQAGGREWATAEARRRLGAAVEALGGAELTRSAREGLTELAHTAVDREV